VAEAKAKGIQLIADALKQTVKLKTKFNVLFKHYFVFDNKLHMTKIVFVINTNKKKYYSIIL